MKNSITRRTLIKTGLKTGLLLPFFSQSLLSCSPEHQASSKADDKSIKQLKILILGGTSFLGPHQVAYALSRGHTVSTFTRGKTKPTVHQELFKDVEQLIGDREDNLTALENGSWDLVIDNSGRKVAWTKKSADLLKDKAELYLYTSSTGVYYPYLGNDIPEQTKVLLEEPSDIQDEASKLEYWYGVMKANSEIEAINAFGQERTIVVRPTYMIGPADKLDRFIHWPVRLAKGGEILVPGKKEDPVQYIDVRDVAEWMIRLAEEKAAGTYNAVGPKEAQTMHEFILQAQQAFEVESSVVSIDDYEFLKANNIHHLVPWILPEENNFGSARINNKKGIEAGLTLRNIETSIKDTYDWWYSNALSEERRNKFEANAETIFVREKSILDSWKKLKKS